MTAPSLPSPPVATHPPAGGPFQVQLPAFQGTLTELASALRTGRVVPGEVPLLALTREVLAWVGGLTGGSAAGWAEAQPDLLPALAQVIALKARLLLPQPDPEEPGPDDDFGELEELVAGVEALAELDALVGFLAARRAGGPDSGAALPGGPAAPAGETHAARQSGKTGEGGAAGGAAGGGAAAGP